MTQSLKFVLDSNVFMEAHRRYYAFDFAPCFWRVLLELAEKGLVISIDRVKDEIMKSSQKDALSYIDGQLPNFPAGLHLLKNKKLLMRIVNY